MFEIIYHEEVVKKDIPKLSADWQDKICLAIESKLTTRPEVYGKPLRRSLKHYRKLRVGHYRVIFRIEGQHVKVFVIQHRSRVYSNVGKRI
jgi:mRNA interferase RelE/StbE